ncbi:MAG TPA: 2'-5' RNA ligase family protein [Mucilaginibacter sp.]
MKHYADYMLLLSPTQHVKDLVKEHKEYSANVIGKYESMHSIAHVSIKKMPRQKAFLTEPSLLALNKGLKTLPPITLTIDGFDYFNHGDDYKTIYARLRTNHITTLWFKTLKKHLNMKEFMVPHITIARNIPVTDFNKLWPHFKAINWVENFTVNELTVLQRETFATFATWEPFTSLPFEAKNLVEPPVKREPLKTINMHNGQISLF